MYMYTSCNVLFVQSLMDEGIGPNTGAALLMDLQPSQVGATSLPADGKGRAPVQLSKPQSLTKPLVPSLLKPLVPEPALPKTLVPEPALPEPMVPEPAIVQNTEVMFLKCDWRLPHLTMPMYCIIQHTDVCVCVSVCVVCVVWCVCVCVWCVCLYKLGLCSLAAEPVHMYTGRYRCVCVVLTMYVYTFSQHPLTALLPPPQKKLMSA